VVFAATDPGPGSKVRVPPADRPTLPVDTVPPPTTPTVPTTTSDGRATVPISPPTTVDDHGGNRGPNPGSGSSGSGSSGSGSGTSGSGSAGSGKG
jgi:hypothetical protein